MKLGLPVILSLLLLPSLGRASGDTETAQRGEQQRIAVVDMDALMRGYNGAEPARQELERQQGEIKAELEKMKTDLQKVQADYEAARSAARAQGLSKEALETALENGEEKLSVLKETEVRIRMAAEQRGKEMLDRRAQMRRRIREEVSAAISRYAAKNNIKLVLDSGRLTGEDQSSNVVFRDPALDVTPQVLEILNAGSRPAEAKGGAGK